MCGQPEVGRSSFCIVKCPYAGSIWYEILEWFGGIDDSSGRFVCVPPKLVCSFPDGGKRSFARLGCGYVVRLKNYEWSYFCFEDGHGRRGSGFNQNIGMAMVIS